MGIKVKKIQRSFNRSLHYDELLVRMQIPRVLCHAFVFYVFQESF